jgi:tol-pal system protein YbgF
MLVVRRPSPILLALAASLSLAACAHGTSEPTQAPDVALGPHDGRDGAALRRRLEILEDRVLHLEQRTTAEAAAMPTGTTTSHYSLPDGRQLPVVRLGDREPVPAPAPAPAPRAEPTARSPAIARGTSRLLAAPVAAPPEEDLSSSIFSEEDPAAAAGDGPARSYRLEGTRLVDLTIHNAPKRPDRPDRSKKGAVVVATYEAAMTVYKTGAFEDAERAFDAFARANPRHDFADNALYWKGEAAYDQAHFADALAAFTEVVERYGGGNKAPDALLKIGLCYRQLGDDDNARDVLTELISAYPGERASDIARVKLAQFGI